MRLVWIFAALTMIGGCGANAPARPDVVTPPAAPHATVEARIELSQTVVRRGHGLRATLVLTNDSGHNIPYCHTLVLIGLAKPGLAYQPAVPADGCNISGQLPTIAQGTTRLTLSVDTRYQQCTAGQPSRILPRCLSTGNGGTAMPPLPVGTYHLALSWTVLPAPETRPSPPVTVTS